MGYILAFIKICFQVSQLVPLRRGGERNGTRQSAGQRDHLPAVVHLGGILAIRVVFALDSI
jgi:hypothetical protein